MTKRGFRHTRKSMQGLNWEGVVEIEEQRKKRAGKQATLPKELVGFSKLEKRAITEAQTMNIKIEASKKIEDGVHKGIITDVEYRTEPYEYTDVVIEMPDKVQIKASYPTMICPTSKLGRLLTRFGLKLEVGHEIDPNKVLIGKKVVFQTTSEDKQGVKYSKVLTESLQPQ